VDASPVAGYGLPDLILTIIPPGDTATRRNATWIQIVARLEDRVSMQKARAGLETFAGCSPLPRACRPSLQWE
jgi:hypothetical protein